MTRALLLSSALVFSAGVGVAKAQVDRKPSAQPQLFGNWVGGSFINGVAGLRTCNAASVNATGDGVVRFVTANKADGVVMLLTDPAVDVPFGTQATALLTFDDGSGAKAHAEGDGKSLGVAIDDGIWQKLSKHLRSAHTMKVSFEGIEGAWTFSLNGSSAAFDAFDKCDAALDQPPAEPQQPAPPPAESRKTEPTERGAAPQPTGRIVI